RVGAIQPRNRDRLAGLFRLYEFARKGTSRAGELRSEPGFRGGIFGRRLGFLRLREIQPSEYRRIRPPFFSVEVVNAVGLGRKKAEKAGRGYSCLFSESCFLRAPR